MPRRLLAVFVLGLMSAALPAAAKPSAITGVYLTTRYPDLTVRGGEATTIDLELRDFHLPPQLFVLSVPQVARGWKATLLGGGQPVGSVMVMPDGEQELQLRLEPPAGAGPGDYRFLVEARSQTSDLKLPLTVTIGRELPAKLKLSTEFPALRGTPTTSYKFRIKVANDSGRDAMIDLSAAAPKNFQVSFTEAYGTQQITTLPIKAGQSKEIDAAVALPSETPAGTYRLSVTAKSAAATATIPLSVTIVGQPQLELSGEGGRLSGSAYAGEASELTAVVRNDGSAAARDVSFSATAPDGWKTHFDPQRLAVLPAGKAQRIKVTLIPPPQAIAGDYQTTLRASAADGLDQSADFRITVLTSTLWGTVGIAIIAAALLVVVFAVARFGRR
jgi:uncharacterized membrane protein